PALSTSTRAIPTPAATTARMALIKSCCRNVDDARAMTTTEMPAYRRSSEGRREVRAPGRTPLDDSRRSRGFRNIPAAGHTGRLQPRSRAAGGTAGIYAEAGPTHPFSQAFDRSQFAPSPLQIVQAVAFRPEAGTVGDAIVVDGIPDPN